MTCSNFISSHCGGGNSENGVEHISRPDRSESRTLTWGVTNGDDRRKRSAKNLNAKSIRIVAKRRDASRRND